ncbi:hypothetical protein, partial [Herbiconiux daphne]
MLEDHGIHVRLGEGLFFEAFQWEAYPNSSGKGKMTGFMSSLDEYVEVQAPGVGAEVFVEGREYTGRILSCYVMNYILHVVVANPKPREHEQTINLASMIDTLTNLPFVVDKPLPGYDRVITDIPQTAEEEITEEDEEEAVSAVTADGTVVTKKEWESNGA